MEVTDRVGRLLACLRVKVLSRNVDHLVPIAGAASGTVELAGLGLVTQTIDLQLRDGKTAQQPVSLPGDQPGSTVGRADGGVIGVGEHDLQELERLIRLTGRHQLPGLLEVLALGGVVRNPAVDRIARTPALDGCRSFVVGRLVPLLVAEVGGVPRPKKFREGRDHGAGLRVLSLAALFSFAVESLSVDSGGGGVSFARARGRLGRGVSWPGSVSQTAAPSQAANPAIQSRRLFVRIRRLTRIESRAPTDLAHPEIDAACKQFRSRPGASTKYIAVLARLLPGLTKIRRSRFDRYGFDRRLLVVSGKMASGGGPRSGNLPERRQIAAILDGVMRPMRAVDSSAFPLG